ncbi:MAG: HU family DNA-binding protein [Deltaproteobacteria bacterium]|nr:HU family DNA-binding protein [Deltaproteobacteria bacterium]
MTKAELIDAVAGSKDVPADLSKKAVQAVIDETFAQMKKVVKKDGRFSFPGFGTFNKKKRKARTGRNPQTGEKIKIKAQTTVSFRPAQGLKDFIAGATPKKTK